MPLRASESMHAELRGEEVDDVGTRLMGLARIRRDLDLAAPPQVGERIGHGYRGLQPVPAVIGV